jgi:F0F1-type ATP synthase assembly protein I
LIGGLITLGGLGYLIDRLVGTQTIFTGIGFVLGGGAGVYIIYLRYGRGDGDGDRT